MMDYFIFGGVDTRTYNVHIFDLNTDSSPVSLDEGIIIPGKNGRLLMLNEYYDNVEHRYMGVIYSNAAVNFPQFRDAILGVSGYQRLTDSIHPDEFYSARYIGGLEAKLTPDRTMVKFVIEFSRKPQRFLLDGETEIQLSGSRTFTNPSTMTANPLIKVTGYGNLTVGGKTVTIANHSRSYVMIDSEMKDCYYSSYNMNRYVTFSNHQFPAFKKGNTSVSYSGNISGVTVKPRWWRA